MKKYPLYSIMLFPCALFAQEEVAPPTESNVEAVEEISTEAVVQVNSADILVVDEPTVVEIEDAPIPGASIDPQEETVPTVVKALPSSSEVLLDIPGQDGGAGAAVMGQEETISVDFPDEDVRTILRNVADLFDLNLVIPDSLQGRTSLKLRNITWRQVFEVVLEPLGFTYVEDRNIIRVKSINELTTEPVDTRVFIINFSNAEQIKGSVAPMVDAASGGRIQVDKRSNALVITERPSRMNKIQEIVERLDRATDQVMIESKFVEVRKTNGKDLGVDWSSLGEEGGINLRAGDFASRISGENGTLIGSADLMKDELGLANGVTGILTENPLDTAVFSADSFTAILRALQSSNKVKLVSNPTVVTMDNEKALIKISREYPQPDFTFNAETGQRQFNGLGEPIDVGITLEVTPTVNSAGFINLDIFPEVSSTSEDRVIEGTAFPIRDVRTAQTRIMIKDGFTLALGGLVSSSVSDGQSRVPLLGDIPGVGRLFRNDTSSVEESNLIIFITAKTLNPDGTDYRDTVDPRLLDRMKITPSMVPGYQLTEEEADVIEKVEVYRQEAQVEESTGKIKAEIMSIEEAKRKEAEKAAREAEGTVRRSAGPNRVN